MSPARHSLRLASAVFLLVLIPAQFAFAWGHFGHEMINRLAVEKLPSDVPEFLRSPAAAAALEYYGPQPDRWRATAEAEKDPTPGPEHFLDLEWADQTGAPLPRRRYDFIRTLDAVQAQKLHPEINFTAENIGLLPWAIYESWQRLTAAMREYRYSQSKHQDTKPVEQEILVLAGTLGHFVADGSQPLHVSMEYNGWTGPNPNGYEGKGIHSRFESNFLNDNIKAQRDIAPLMISAPAVIPDVFADTVTFLRKSNTFVEPVYQMDKVHAFEGAGTPQSRALVAERLATGATKLRDLIYTAWITSATPLPGYTPTTPAKK